MELKFKFKPRETPYWGMTQITSTQEGGATRPFTLCHTVWLKATKFGTAIHLGKEGFSEVASPRPYLEFSLPRLGLELSASVGALPRQNCLEPISGL